MERERETFTERERERELTPARGGSTHQLVGSWVPEEIPPLARAFAVFLLGSGHDSDDEDEDEAARSRAQRRPSAMATIRERAWIDGDRREKTERERDMQRERQGDRETGRCHCGPPPSSKPSDVTPPITARLRPDRLRPPLIRGLKTE